MQIGFTCSTFDLFHAGHVLMLREARSVCDYLIVGLQTDPSRDRPEKNSPIQTVAERMIQVGACKYVDELIVYETEDELLQILRSFPITVRIIGEEYQDKPFTGKDIDWHTVYYNSRRHDWSSSSLRDKVWERENQRNETD